jgi:uncharacterized coiled-coil protein SlyX
MEASLEARVVALEVKTSAIDVRLDAFSDRLSRLEGSVDSIDSKIDSLVDRDRREFEAKVARENRLVGLLEATLMSKQLWLLLGLFGVGCILLVYGTLVNPPQLHVGLDGFSIAPGAKANRGADLLSPPSSEP